MKEKHYCGQEVEESMTKEVVFGVGVKGRPRLKRMTWRGVQARAPA